MKKVIKFAKEFSPSIIALATPFLAFAQVQGITGVPTNGSVPQGNITNLDQVLQSVCTIFGDLFFFLIALAVIFVVIAAFKYLTAAGNPETVKAAGTMLLYTAIAIVVALLARALPLVIASFLGTSVQTC